MIFPYHRYFITFLLAFWLLACSSVPVQEMSDARQAVNAARIVDVSGKPSTQFHEANNLLKRAEMALENGEYDRARTLAVKARQKAVVSRLKAMNSNMGK